ncbi:DUF448 domain-containing protein [Desulfogranum japonicum]|uniref:DUF448 domain-containing protein n=1 Tax=Desulfogranum japonicum TaxID=231447 RepID=UPI0038BAB23D
MPHRTCRGCGLKVSRGELQRYVWHKGALIADDKGDMPGRGVYCCKNEQCYCRLRKKKKMLKHVLRIRDEHVNGWEGACNE